MSATAARMFFEETPSAAKALCMRRARTTSSAESPQPDIAFWKIRILAAVEEFRPPDFCIEIF
jgi:hypothetical protein